VSPTSHLGPLPPRPPTAALVIIGDEILTGKFRDDNGPWLIDRCRALGIDLRRISVIPDEVETIGEEVAVCSRRFDWTFTSGGVGPTHDDVTMEGIARGLGRPVQRLPELEAVLRARLVERITEDALRMADAPAGASLWWDGEIAFPQVVVENIVILPGVPALFRARFLAIAHRFGGTPSLSRRLVTTEAESLIAGRLRLAQARWPQVAIGSYPRYEQRPYTVIVILDSRDEPALLACLDWLRDALSGQLLDEPDGSPGR